MNKKILVIVGLIVFTLPAFAVDCNKKPCHSKCINSQPSQVQLQCKCDARKKIYYHYGRIGVPEYNEVCDGSFDQYVVKYCAAKRDYDDIQLGYATTNGGRYIPRYEPYCDGSRAEYDQKIQIIRQNQYNDALIRALRAPTRVNVNHSGTVNHNVNQTIRLDGSMYHYGY